jgi:dTDP-glucose 4,6-dehydratase
MKLLVTGGAGFIGSNFVRYIAANDEHEIIALDKLTYAGRTETIQDLIDDDRVSFVHADICDSAAVNDALEGCDALLNFAAESHVDRSIEEPGAFIQTEVFGTYVLLEQAREHQVGRYLQVSTDEVYGSIDEGSFTEATPIDPSLPIRRPRAAAICSSALIAARTGSMR